MQNNLIWIIGGIMVIGAIAGALFLLTEDPTPEDVPTMEELRMEEEAVNDPFMPEDEMHNQDMREDPAGNEPLTEEERQQLELELQQEMEAEFY